jgi:hypothetical protein
MAVQPASAQQTEPAWQAAPQLVGQQLPLAHSLPEGQSMPTQPVSTHAPATQTWFGPQTFAPQAVG